MSNDLMPEQPEAVIFGKTLRRLREARDPKLTQEALAHAAGLTTNYLSDVERGQKVPSLTTVLQLAYALNLPPGDLFADFPPSTLRKLFRH